MSQFLKDYSKTHPEAKKAYCINQQSLSKELRKNASLAIRRRYYDRIIPTSITALQTLPFMLSLLHTQITYSVHFINLFSRTI